MKRKISLESIYYCNLFEKLTKTLVKDCFINDEIIFIVDKGNMSKAIGKKGINVQKIKNVLKKRVKIIEYSENPVNFIKNLVFPLKLLEIENVDNEINIGGDSQTKALLIGRNRKNLEKLNTIFKKYFDIEIKIK